MTREVAILEVLDEYLLGERDELPQGFPPGAILQLRCDPEIVKDLRLENRRWIPLNMVNAAMKDLNELTPLVAKMERGVLDDRGYLPKDREWTVEPWY